MNKLLEKGMRIVAGMLMLLAGYLISKKYNVTYFEFLKSAVLIAIVCAIYLILHESVHAIVAHGFHMKIIFIQFLGIAFCFDVRNLKILKKIMIFGTSQIVWHYRLGEIQYNTGYGIQLHQVC